MRQTVYQIARWSEVFETAESRKYKSLPWISERVDFNSTGWQQGLEEFGPERWLLIYGAWMVIVRVAAAAKTRGVLSGDKGEPWTSARIARPAGVDSKLIAETIEWAVRIGWLISVNQIPSGESPGEIPERQEKIIATERNGTERNETLRHGTERARPAEPSRADVLKSQKPKTAESQPGKAPGDAEKASDSETGTTAVKLATLAKRSPELQRLESIPVTGSGKIWHGSVFSPDRIKPEHIERAETDFWYGWYRDQLTSDSPLLRCGNLAEAAFVLALVYAAKRIPGPKVKKSKLAVWINWCKSRECKAITDSDWKRAIERLEKQISPDAAEPSEDKHDRPAPKPETTAAPKVTRTKRSFAEALKKRMTGIQAD